MPGVLIRRPDTIGFFGSDTFGELDENQSSQLEFEPVIQTEIRFALGGLSTEVKRIRQVISSGGDLVIATSYPRQARRIANTLGFYLSDVIELGGSVEAAPYILREVDAIIDVVDSGQTLKENNLSVVADNLGKLAIGAIWRKYPGSNKDIEEIL